MSDHGTRAAYVKGCKCVPCRAANARYCKVNDYLRANGRTRLVDATRAKAHVAKLRAAGMGRREIARRAGVSLTVINRLAGVDHSRPAASVRPETEAAILALKPGPVAAGVNVPALATVRRLRALVALGYSQTTLAALIGWTPNNMGDVVHARHESVKQSTADRVEQLYDTLSMTPGPSNRARAIAARNGWLPPLAWDDDDLTNPAIDPADARRKASGVHIDDVRELMRSGCTPEQVAWRLGVTRNAVYQVMHRAAS